MSKKVTGAGKFPRDDSKMKSTRPKFADKIETIEMSPLGRYESNSKTNIAFQKVSKVKSIQNTEGLVKAPSEISMALSRMAIHREGLLKHNHATEDPSPEKEDNVEKREVEDDNRGNSDSDRSNVINEDTADRPFLSREKDDSKETAKKSENKAPQLNVSTVVGLRKWRTKTRDRFGSNVRGLFAKNEAHQKLLQKHGDDVIVDLPLPLRLEVFTEFMPVVHNTAKAYSNALGKKHNLTKEAMAKVEKYEKDLAILNELME